MLFRVTPLSIAFDVRVPRRRQMRNIGLIDGVRVTAV
jgi:hypothetical protein